jgi:uncharacterized protein
MEVNKLRNKLKNKKELNVWLRIVFIFIAYIVVFIGTAIIFNAHDGEFWKIRIASTAIKVFMCITVILFTIYVDKKQIEFLGISWRKDSYKMFWIGSLIAAIWFCIIFGIGAGFKVIKDVQWNNNYDSMFFIVTAVFFIHCVLTGLGEELLFRGYIFNNLLEKMSKNKAIIISSAIFLSIHFSSEGSVLFYIDIFLAAIIFAYLYIISKSLYVPIGFHFMSDFLQYTIQIENCPVNPYYLLKFNQSPNLLINGVNLGEQMELVFVVIEILLLVLLKYYNCKKTSSTYSNNIINVN